MHRIPNWTEMSKRKEKMQQNLHRKNRNKIDKNEMVIIATINNWPWAPWVVRMKKININRCTVNWQKPHFIRDISWKKGNRFGVWNTEKTDNRMSKYNKCSIIIGFEIIHFALIGMFGKIIFIWTINWVNWISSISFQLSPHSLMYVCVCDNVFIQNEINHSIIIKSIKINS